MKIAIMQPYFFPYLGYFQLIKSADVFIFYDDVNFKKKGWIHRNQFLVNKKPKLFTIPLKEASQNKLIKEVEILGDKKWLNKFFKTLELNYCKAPFFEETYSLVEKIFNSSNTNLAGFNINCIREISDYLGISKTFKISSETYKESKALNKSDRIIYITKKNKTEHYINLIGGINIYDKNYFKKFNVNLLFLENNFTSYNQFSDKFFQGLSIIDVLMFNSKKKVLTYLDNYKLKQ